ncbi:MAG: PTS sugar transporter subunit IIC [Clostridium sp.]|nr:PTS sugar transporter subunit IIC [Clostridium sp.]MBS5950179.1 PTS sugar transporter subunit IIC [Clostridium sp.]
MNKVLDFIQAFLMEPALLIGLMVFVGYILAKKPIVKVITGTFSAVIGLMMILFGGSQFSSTFKPVAEAVSQAFGIRGYLMDPYAMRATTQEALGSSFALVGYVFLIAFAVNIVLVMFGKYTKARGIFLTGNTGLAHSQAVLWLVIFWFGLNGIVSAVIAGVLVGIYWAYSTTLAYAATEKVTGGAGFTIGHNQTIGIWFFSKISKFFGNPEKHDAENIKLPGWLSIFNHNVTSVAIIMTVFVGGFLLTTGIDTVQELAGKTHWLIYIINLGLNFSMYMVILLTGVRMLVGEINSAFKGIQDKLIPNAVPAVDVAAILPFSPNAATLGFIFCTLGTVLSIAILVFTGSNIIVLPGFVPLFFSGGPIGVVANKYGGIKAVIISCTLLGIIQTFGTVWMIPLMGVPDGVGWVGMFDWATVWPAITEVFKFISGIFGM